MQICYRVQGLLGAALQTSSIHIATGPLNVRCDDFATQQVECKKHKCYGLPRLLTILSILGVFIIEDLIKLLVRQEKPTSMPIVRT